MKLTLFIIQLIILKKCEVIDAVSFFALPNRVAYAP